MQQQRRDFIKLTTAGAAGLMLARPGRALAAWPSNGKMQINPAIDNMKVVACVDPAMMKSKPSSMKVATINAASDYPRIQANMDAMAMALTGKGCPDEAWQTIFRSSKAWADTVVAVKVNAGSEGCIARLAVLQKFSNIFLGWGMKPENYIVYDGNSSATNMLSSSFSTTDKSKVLGVVSAPSGKTGDLLGGFKDAKLGDGTTRKCAGKIADGTVDILIDIAANKGHMYFGKATLCMKNHYGTWQPDTSHTDLNNLIFNMNKGDAIIGGDPPRQQLCMVDSIYSNGGTDVFATPDLQPNYLVMGTFAPAVDYLTVKKVREEVSKLSHDSAVIDTYLTAWGYKTSDAQWVLVPPADPAAVPATCDPASGTGGSGGGGNTTVKGTGGNSGAGGATASTTGPKPGGAGGTTRRNGGAGGSTAKASGGSSGESQGSGGAGRGGSGGSSAVAGAGGGASGGAGGSGGAVASGGSGGALPSSTPGSGGAAASGGKSGTAKAGDSGGCNVRGGGSAGIGVTLAVGALVGVRRLIKRRAVVARLDPSAAATPSVADEGDESGRP